MPLSGNASHPQFHDPRILPCRNMRRPSHAAHDGGPRNDQTALSNITYLEFGEITAPKFAVNRQIEKGKVSGALGQLQSNPNRPDLSEFQWGFGPISRPLFHGL